MRSAKQDGGNDRRKSERRVTTAGAKPASERREVEQRGVAPAMVDALEDILKWERASERAMRVAAASTTSLDDATNSN